MELTTGELLVIVAIVVMTMTKIQGEVFGCSSKVPLSPSSGSEEVEPPAALLKCVRTLAGPTDP